MKQNKRVRPTTMTIRMHHSELEKLDSIKGFKTRSEYIRELILKAKVK